MNGGKFEEIRKKISSGKFVERKSLEPAAEFGDSPMSFEFRIRAASQEIERERQSVEKEFSALKTPKNSPLEKISFPDAPSSEAKKISAQQSEILKELAAEQVATEKNLRERKTSFAEKKAALHKKFLQLKGG